MSTTPETKKTHWREAFDSDYLASWDIENSIILTVEKCVKEVCKIQRKKDDDGIKNVLYFKEEKTSEGVTVKPLILNATNCKKIHVQTKFAMIEDWHGFKVEIGVVANSGRVGHSQGISILRVLNDATAEIDALLINNDLDDVRDKANKLIRQMTADQKKQVRIHIEKLEENV